MSQTLDEKLPSLGAPASRRALVQRVIEVVISLAFLVLALRGINLGALWGALRGANYLWLVPAVLITVGVLAIKGWRWQLMFHPEYRLPLGSVMTALCAGYLASNVLPARLGELVSLILLVTDQPVSVARGLSTIVVQRLLDILSLLIMLVLILPFVTLPPAMTHAAQALGLMALIGTGLLLLFSFWKERLLRWSRVLFRPLRFLDRPSVYVALGHLIDGFATLRTKLGLALIALSLLSWVGSVVVAWTVSRAFEMDVPVTAMVFSVVVVSLGMLVPSSPGYIGVFHYLVTVALAPFGIPKDLALSFALVWHGVNYLTLSISGLIALWLYGTSLGQVLQRWRERGTVAA